MQRILPYIFIVALTLQIFGVPPHVGTEPNVAYAAVRVNYLGVAGKSYLGRTVSPPNLQQGLVGHWTFDGKDMKPNVRDMSGQGNHGSLFNFAATTTKPGKIGQALYFDGSNDVVRMGDVLDDVLMATSSYCAWARPTGTTAQAGYIFGKFTAGNENSWFFRRNGNNQWWFSTYSTDSSLTATLTLEVWQHMCVVYAPTPNTSYLYRDGVLVDTTTTMPAVFNNASQVMIGDRDTNDRPFAGEIDDARLYNRSLSASEVAQIYKLGTGSHQSTTNTPTNLQSGLIGHWTFDGKDMKPNMRDASGQGNHGTLAGFTSTTTVPGKLGQALQFNGTNNAASAAVNLSSYTTASISFWLNWDAYANDDDFAFEYVNNANNQNGFLIDPNETAVPCSGQFGIAYTGTGGTYRAGCFTRPSAGVWHHYVVIFNRSAVTYTAYVDGVLQSTTDRSMGTPPSNFANSSLYFMSRGTSSLFGAGKLDDVRLYNRALSATEVLQLYKLGR